MYDLSFLFQEIFLHIIMIVHFYNCTIEAAKICSKIEGTDIWKQYRWENKRRKANHGES